MLNLIKEIDEPEEFGVEEELIDEECDIKSCGKSCMDDCELYHMCSGERDIITSKDEENNFNVSDIFW